MARSRRNKPEPADRGGDRKDERTERLADALRANLKRRKEQFRAQRDTTRSEGTDHLSDSGDRSD